MKRATDLTNSATLVVGQFDFPHNAFHQSAFEQYNEWAGNDFIRVIDETGEDYLYPAKHFVVIQLPPEIAKSLPAGSALRNGRPG